MIIVHFYFSALFITADAFVVELKEIATSVRRQIQNFYILSAENSDNIQR